MSSYLQTVVRIVAVTALVFSAMLAATLPARAVPIHDYDMIVNLVRSVSHAKTPSDLVRILRTAADSPVPLNIEQIVQESGVKSMGVIWFEGANPRARVWLRRVNAEHLFRDILLNQYLVDGVELTGFVDLELEVIVERPAAVQGVLRLNDVSLRWRGGQVALEHIHGSIPFSRKVGAVSMKPEPAPDTGELQIKHLMWAGRVLTRDFIASGSYYNRILKFEDMHSKAMDGNIVGSMLLDHRGPEWRTAAILKLDKINLNMLEQILPGLPILARFTKATMSGRLGIAYQAGGRLQLMGEIESIEPGVVEISSRLKLAMGDTLKSRIVNFQKLKISLEQNEESHVVARIGVYRRTAQSLKELAEGVPFNPVMLSIHVPLIPIVSELAKPGTVNPVQ